MTIRGSRALCAIAGLTFSSMAFAQSATDRRVWPEEGPAKWAPRSTASEITANDLRTRLYQFADDSMQGRRIGEPGNVKGTDYIAREFARLGLKPGGDNGTWFQELAWGPTGYEREKSRLTAAGQSLVPVTDWFPLAPMTNIAIGGRADLREVPTVFAGRWNDTIDLDPAIFRGKVAVYIGLPLSTAGGRGGGRGGRGGAAALPACETLPNRFGAAAAAIADAGRLGRNRRPGTGAIVASTASDTLDTRHLPAGVVGMLFVGLESLPASTVGDAFNTRMGIAPGSTGPSVDVPGAAISSTAAARLFDRPLGELKVGDQGTAVSASWDNAWRKGPVPARNVIAILPGSDPARANEYVLVGAHNDHNGVAAAGVDHDSIRAVNTVTRRQGSNDPSCRPSADQQHMIDSMIARARSIRPPRRDSINNGADDDGSGSMLMLEIAERFAKEKPARSIIFISHQGEEGGLRGSRWFVDHPTVPLENIVAAHNMDMVGKGRVTEVKYGGPSSVQMLGARRLSREFGDIIDSVNAVRTETMAIDRSWDATTNPMNRFCRSDQVNYVRKNVPVVYISLGYTQDYHQVTDEPQYIDYDHSARLGRFVYDIMWAIATRKDRPAIAGPDPSYPNC
jgi:peptidase M28-like protein